MPETNDIFDEIENTARSLTPANAKRLADLHLALTQLYREIAGLNPLTTAAHQRKETAKHNNQVAIN